jgi:hypothetical protein
VVSLCGAGFVFRAGGGRAMSPPQDRQLVIQQCGSG